MKCRTKQTFYSHVYSDFSIKSDGKEEDLCVSEKLTKQETEGRGRGGEGGGRGGGEGGGRKASM